MGAVYTTELDLKFADRAGAAKALYGYVCNELMKRSPNCFGEAEVVESVERLFSLLLASFQGDYEYVKSNENGFECFESSFHATYSWSEVLDEAFKSIAPYLEDGSTYYQVCENDWDTYKIVDGKILLVESNWQEVPTHE